MIDKRYIGIIIFVIFIIGIILYFMFKKDNPDIIYIPTIEKVLNVKYVKFLIYFMRYSLQIVNSLEQIIIYKKYNSPSLTELINLYKNESKFFQSNKNSSTPQEFFKHVNACYLLLAGIIKSSSSQNKDKFIEIFITISSRVLLIIYYLTHVLKGYKNSPYEEKIITVMTSIISSYEIVFDSLKNGIISLGMTLSPQLIDEIKKYDLLILFD